MTDSKSETPYLKMPTGSLHNPRLPKFIRLLIAYQNGPTKNWMMSSTFGEICGMTTQQVLSARKVLVEKGLIEVVGTRKVGGKDQPIYSVVVVEDVPCGLLRKLNRSTR